MLYRRLLHDDGKGVAEALNETVCIDNQCEGLIVSSVDQPHIHGHSISIPNPFPLHNFISSLFSVDLHFSLYVHKY